MKVYRILIVLVLALLATGIAVQAQGHNGAGSQVRAELERTDMVLDRAKEMVRNATSPQAAVALNQAVELQKSAWDRFNDEQYIIAYQLTRLAREKAQYSLANGRLAEQNDAAVLRKLESVERLMDRASEEVAESNNASLKAVLESARNNLDKAWELYRSDQYRPAIKLADQVEKAVTRVLSAADQEIGDASTFERRLSSFDDSFTRAEERLQECPSEAAAQLLEQARTSRQQARDLAAEGQYENALKALRQAREQVVQAVEICRSPETLTRRLETLRQKADHLAELVGTSDDVAVKLIGQAHDQLSLAERYIRQNNNEAAAAALRAAELALQQAEKRSDWNNL